MFCSKCGKMIDSGEICSECLEKKAAKNEENATTVQEPKDEPIAKEMPYQQYPHQPQYQQPHQPQYPPQYHGAYEQQYYQYQQPYQPQYPPQYHGAYEQQYYQYQQPAPMPDPKNRMYGFGKALTATILSYVSFFFAYFAIIIYAVSIEAPIALAVLAIPPAIISIIFGAKSISTFKARAKTCAKPIPTLILGIEGLAMGATSALLLFLFFMMDCTISGLYYY